MPYSNCLGWANLANVYDECLVHGCKIVIRIWNSSTTIPVRLNIVPIDNDLLVSLPVSGDGGFVNTKYAVQTEMSTKGGGREAVSLSSAIKVSELYGGPLDLKNDELQGYCGGANSSTTYTFPADRFSWYVSASSMNGSNLALD